ncbi:heptaprenylglyceryl phosphate synthase [Paenibacillus flagellatus]|uniref:Heptaprenylglyceryl phosphate synthase n=1 Tax=Paenibacillus flagellatus TaxID=2211139 RepID=A0A2V5KBF7_9BACL|nr:heptaprenylglyceryl phosphate synthase [Paenibacillus flagellatus]PYI51230.1 heptaprenylglyceryl phosphate synthase [Paenibacillus flagellatus]
MHIDINGWKHVFKLDPDRDIDDSALERLCLSGTDAVMVGGTTGVTFDNTVDLLSRIRRFEVPCALEISNPDAIVPGFDLYFIPVVLNAGDPDWIVGHHHRAVKEYGPMMQWEQIVPEGYVIVNGDCSAARVTGARTELDPDDAVAYARMAERLFRFPVVYIEYSGTFGDMELVKRAAASLGGARLFYGGGIDGAERARQAAEAAHTIVVGNVIYENLDRALETVPANPDGTERLA